MGERRFHDNQTYYETPALDAKKDLLTTGDRQCREGGVVDDEQST